MQWGVPSRGDSLPFGGIKGVPPQFLGRTPWSIPTPQHGSAKGTLSTIADTKVASTASVCGKALNCFNCESHYVKGRERLSGGWIPW